MANASTVGELRRAGYPDRTVKQELRDNLVAKLGAGQELFASIVGFSDSVLPALERGILAGHDLILLGERGQAKTRLIRRLVELLDESMPAIEGCEVNDHPYRPICGGCRARLEEQAGDTKITWIARDRRFSEKLATPDTSVADLIGDIDPIRVAEGRYLSDELAIHFGLIPRTHRGIFGINELPDLPERIQVALLNILEERDVQVRGFKVRLPLDLLLVATANPEDYTHRGRIISPLKDRFGTQIRTHYPEDIQDEIAIMDQEARAPHTAVPLHVPAYIKKVLAELTAQLRRSPQVNQRSGVSVRFSIGNLETVAASAIRRAVRGGERTAAVRPVDLWTLVGSSVGRLEFETMEEGREEKILQTALKSALAEVYRSHLGGENFGPLIERFEQGFSAQTSDLTPAADFMAQFEKVPGLARIMSKLGMEAESPEAAASALEFALEGLHLMRRINKQDCGPAASRYSR